jgi:hypothetical protein
MPYTIHSHVLNSICASVPQNTTHFLPAKLMVYFTQMYMIFHSDSNVSATTFALFFQPLDVSGSPLEHLIDLLFLSVLLPD